MHGPSGQPLPACDIKVWISLGENAAPTYGFAARAIVDSAGRASVAAATDAGELAAEDIEIDVVLALGLVNVGAGARTPDPGGGACVLAIGGCDFSAG